MNYEQFVRKQLKKPLALSAYIILSFIAFMQMISLFVGRWIDFVEFGSVVLLVVTVWLIFAQATSKKKMNQKMIVTCTFAWSIVKLVSIGIALLMVVISSVYMCVKNSDYGYGNELMAAGILVLLLAGGIYGMRLVIGIFSLKECVKLQKNTNSAYIFRYNWFVWGIVSAGLRFGGMLVLIIVSAVVGDTLCVLDCYNSSTFASILDASMGTGSVVMVSIIDLCYVAFFILFAISIKVYNNALCVGKNK